MLSNTSIILFSQLNLDEGLEVEVEVEDLTLEVEVEVEGQDLYLLQQKH
jgi:antitoxin component of MazEF toxin-antitoxin module